MDFDQNLLRLQRALGGFTVATSDHEKLEILSALFQNVDESSKLKMVFFLIINTRMKLTDLIKDDPNIGLLTDICQNLDCPALSYLILNMNLVSYLSEIAINSPASFTLELFNGIFAYADTRAKVRGLENVLVAVFEKIMKITKGIHEDDYALSQLWDYMYTFADMLWCKYTFENEDLYEEDMTKILDACLTCVNLYQGRKALTYNPTYELKVLYAAPIPSDFHGMRIPNCKTKLVNYLYRLLDLFNDYFCYAFSYDTSEAERQLMSETAYTLYEYLENSDIKPSNLNYLNSIKKKPETEHEKIAKADVSTIINYLSSGRGTNNWFKALISHQDVFDDEDAIYAIKDNLNLADSQDLMSIVTSIQNMFERGPVSNFASRLYFCCLGKMPLVDQLFHFEHFFMMDHKPYLENPTFDADLTEMFNKMYHLKARDIATKSRLINFCIRSPVKTIMKICENALFNSQQLNVSVEDLKMLKAACLSKETTTEPDSKRDIITSVLHNMIDKQEIMAKEKPLFVNLIARLQKEKLLDEKIEVCIMDVIHKELSEKKYEKTEFGLDILKSTVKLKLLRSKEVSLMAFLSQVLDQTSWSFSDFTSEFVKIRETSIAIKNTIMKNPKFAATADPELAWLRNEITNLWHLNRVYFCDVWYSYGCEFPASKDLYVKLFILLHTKVQVQPIIESIVETFQTQKLLDLRISFTAAFIQILPIMTGKEWTTLLTRMTSIISGWLEFQEEKPDMEVSLIIFRIFTTSLYTLAQDMNKNKDMIPCFSFCIRNLGKMIQQNFVTGEETMKYEVAVVFVEELLFLLNGIEDEIFRKENSFALSPVILEIANRGKDSAKDKGNKLEELEEWYKKEFICETPTETLLDD